jgi:aspartate/methionine/tyrosine aminotransferase
MFSARLPPLEHNRISLLSDRLRAAEVPLVDLTESNPTLVGLRYPVEGVLNALADPRALVYRPSANGMQDARDAVAAYYQRRFAVDVDPMNIWLTASTSESYSWLFKLLCNAGEKVLVPRPSYPLFEHLCQLEGVRAEPYALRYHSGWYLDPAELRARLDADTRAVVLVSPNNPTGSFLKKSELQGIVDLCRGRNVALICDEVFADYAFGPDSARVATNAGNQQLLTFVLSGLSKPAGLPQVKLGWICASGPARLVEGARERLMLIADTYLSVSSSVQLAAPRLFDLVDEVGGQIRERVRANRAAVKTAVRGSAVQLLDGEGGWSAVLRLPATRTEEEWVMDLLEKDHVVVHPGFFFDFEEEAYLVVSLLCAESELAVGVQKIVARVERGTT